MATAVLFECDGTLAGGRPYGDLLAQALVARGWEVRQVGYHERWTRHPDAGIHLVSGGETSAREQSGWMAERLDDLGGLLHDAGRRGPVLGVCLGAQMLAAVAAGRGSVGAASRMAVGLEPIVLSATGEQRVVPSFHYERIDQARVRAAGVEVLATGLDGAVEALRVADGVVGVQFHPELGPDALAEVVRDHAGLIEVHGADAAAVLADVEARAAAAVPQGGWPVVEELWPHLDPPTD